MQSDNNEVSRDAVYSELYEEMRRYRDYELTASAWYTAILASLLGVIISVKFSYDSKPSDLALALSTNWVVQVILAVGILVSGIASLTINTARSSAT